MKTFKEHRFARNPQERVFVEEFVKQFGKGVSTSLIVFGHPTNSLSPKEYLTEREQDIVLSTIQWLGSPVGEGFLQDCGFKKMEDEH